MHERARDAQSATADSLRIVMWILVFARACSFVPKNCPDVPGVTFRPAHGAGSRDVAVSETAPNRHAQGGVDCRYANNDRLHEEIGRGNAGCGLLPAVRGADRRPLLDHKAEAMQYVPRSLPCRAEAGYKWRWPSWHTSGTLSSSCRHSAHWFQY